MQVSHSRIECFKKCPYQFKLRYLEGLQTIKDDAPDNALFLGTAMHTGIEKGVQEAIQEYFNQYPIITDYHINESIKLEVMIPKVQKMLPSQGRFEVKIEDDDFKGFIDYIAPVEGESNVCDLYDFKYSNNVEHYRESVQLHLYKYFFEKMNPTRKIRNLYYLCIPKIQIRQKKTEGLQQFRKRLRIELKAAEPQLIQVDYDPSKVMEWLFDVKHTIESTEHEKNESWLCRYCEFNGYCQKGEDYMLLPKNERRNIEKIQKKVVWLYGAPFSGKTTFANKFEEPLMLNTDGNIKFVDAPYIPIRDEIKVTGRVTSKTLAWNVFKDVITELEKKQNDFKTIIVDLLEDCYEYCRLYTYEQMGITHESDDMRSWDKVTTEFLSTLKRLMALDYDNIILISHEDTSKDIMKRGGDKVTAIKPNLRDKVSNKVAGMVDIVGRVIADGDVRTLSFKSNEVVFGGGRLKTNKNEIVLDYDEFLKVYEEANKNAVSSMTSNKRVTGVKEESEVNTSEPQKPVLESAENASNEMIQAAYENILEYEQEMIEKEKQEEEKPKTRTRKRRA